jgi:hypothetical protein
MNPAPHDLIWLFTRYWWLIFPLFWMGVAMMGIWSRHTRANRSLDLIKSYADQGKDPPPELLKALQGGGDWGGWCGPRYGRFSPERRLHRTFLFGALAVAFAVLYFGHSGDDNWHHHGFGYLMPLVIFTALACSNLFSLILGPRLLPPPSDRDEPRP